MTAVCPKCRQQIPTEDINVGTDVALCRACDLVHKLSGLMQVAEITHDVDLSHPPAGTWLRRQGNTTVVGASHRSVGGALGLLFFTVFWNGIVSVFVGLALISTLKHMGVAAPTWFPGPKGADLPLAMAIGLWIFLIPFILIGIAVAVGFVFCLGGRTEITIQGGNGVIFSGIGPLGRRRVFQTKNVQAVRLAERQWRNRRGDYNSSREIVIELRDGKTLKLASGLREERMKFIAAALTQQLKV